MGQNDKILQDRLFEEKNLPPCHGSNARRSSLRTIKHPAACCHACCSPAGPCDVRGVMLHLGPGASRKRVPPSPDVPSGNTLGSITRAQSQVPYGMQPPRQPEVRLVITRILRPLTRPTARRAAVPAPPVPLRITAARHAVHPPAAKRLRAPACGIMFVPHIMPPAPKNPVAMRQGLRFGNVFRVVHIGGSRGHLRALRRQVLSSSLPALPRSYRRLCSLVIPAGSLDPAPCGGKEHLSVLRSQNPLGNGFAKNIEQSRGGGVATRNKRGRS